MHSLHLLLTAHTLLHTTLILYSLRAARELHNKMAQRVLYATMAWFDATPSGRLINRFSQDISTIDTSVMSRLQVDCASERLDLIGETYFITRSRLFSCFITCSVHILQRMWYQTRSTHNVNQSYIRAQ